MEYPEPYEKCLEHFDTVISAATGVSQGAAGRRSATNKHYWASVLFTRLCGASISLLLLLPRNRLARATIDHWDYAAVAALARQVVETYFAFFYLCVDRVSEEEWQCRWNVFNLHDCMSRIRLFEALKISSDDVKGFEQQLEELRNRLKKNKYFSSLDDRRQRELLRGRSAYLLSQDEIIARLGADTAHFRGLYQFMSAHVHTLPLSFYRIGEERGRGLENRVEKDYICMTLNYLDQYIVRAIREMVELFPGSADKLSEKSRQAVF